MDDYAPSMGAALSYYTVFSLAPLLLIVIAVAGMVFGAEAARGQVMAQLSGLIGDAGAKGVQDLLANADKPARSLFASIVGIVTLVAGATSVFGELQSDLDRIWEVPAEKKPTGIFAILRSRLLSFGLVLALGFLLLVSLVISAGLAAVGRWWGPMFGHWTTVLMIVNFVFSFIIVTTLFAFIYKILPRAQVGWQDVWIGASVTAILFSIGKWLIGLYIGKTAVASGFGAAGSFVVLLIWVYYSAQIFLLGAEFTWVFAHEHGSKSSTRAKSPEKIRAASHAAVVPGSSVC
jgi:membrane protein